MVYGVCLKVFSKPLNIELKFISKLSWHVSEADHESDKITLEKVIFLICIIILDQEISVFAAMG